MLKPLSADPNAPATAIPYDPAEGFEEDVSFAVAFTVFEPVYGKGPLPMLAMLEEASTGHSGALGRQITLDAVSAAPGSQALADTHALLDVLEAADARGSVNLRVKGRRQAASAMVSVTLSYRAAEDLYKSGNDAQVFTRELCRSAPRVIGGIARVIRRRAGVGRFRSARIGRRRGA